MKRWLGRLTWAACIIGMLAFLLLGSKLINIIGEKPSHISEVVSNEEVSSEQANDAKPKQSVPYSERTIQDQTMKVKLILQEKQVEHEGLFRDDQGLVLQLADENSYRWALTEFSRMPIVRVIQVRYSIQELEEAKALVLEQSGVNEAGGWLLEQENRIMILADNEAEFKQLSGTIQELELSKLVEATFIVELIDQTSAV